MNRPLRDALVGGAIGACLLVPIYHTLCASGAAMDEGALLLYPELTLKGYLPYRDFETFYGPGNLWLLAAVYKIFGANLFVERGVGLFCRLIILVAAFQISRRWNIWVAASCMVVTGLLLSCTGPLAAAVITAIAFALCALWSAMETDNARRCFLSGAFAGFCALSRLDFGPAILLALLPTWISMKRRGRIAFLGGAILTIAPLFVLAVADFSDVFANLVTYPVFRSNPARRLPIGWTGWTVAKVTVMHVGGVIAMFVAALLVPRVDTRPSARSTLIGLGFLGLFTLPYALERFDAIHAIPASLVSIGFLPLALMLIAGRLFRSVAPATIAVVSGVLITLSLLAIFPGFTAYLARTFHLSPQTQAFAGEEGVLVWHNERVFALDNEQDAYAVRTLLAQIESLAQPGQRLFVGPGDLRRTNYCDTYLYHMLPQLTPATYFLEMNPLSANRPDSRLARDIASADWLILNRAIDRWNEPNESSTLGSDEPNAVVRVEFGEVFDCGSYVLYRKKPSARPH